MQAAVRALVDEANRAGGRDNITVVAFRLEDAAAPAGAGTAAAAAEGATLIGAARRGGRPDRHRGSPPRRRRGAPASAARSSPPPARAAACAPRPRCSAVLAVLAALAFGAWYGSRQVWFLGTDDAGRVALYRGVPYELPFGIKLYDERYASPIQTESLPPQAPRRGHRPRPALARRRRLPDRRHPEEPGGSLTSARNRELTALVPGRPPPHRRLRRGLRPGGHAGSATSA